MNDAAVPAQSSSEDFEEREAKGDRSSWNSTDTASISTLKQNVSELAVAAGGGHNQTDPSAEKTRGRPFAPGQSGNGAGRPRGSRNRTTLAAEQLLDGEAEALTRKVIELA